MSILLRNRLIIAISVAVFAGAYAANAALVDVVFPVPELGNCTSREACKAYCDEPDHMVACSRFAEKNKLVSSDQVRRVEKFVALLKSGGPGSCRTADSCRTYCDDPAHRAECAAHADRNGLRPSPSASPRVTPRQTERPRPPAASVSALPPKPEREIERDRPEIPKEFLNGGATNLPTPADRQKIEKQSRGIGSALLGLFISILFGGTAR